jgi:hypothetical protein
MLSKLIVTDPRDTPAISTSPAISTAASGRAKLFDIRESRAVVREALRPDANEVSGVRSFMG